MTTLHNKTKKHQRATTTATTKQTTFQGVCVSETRMRFYEERVAE